MKKIYIYMLLVLSIFLTGCKKESNSLTLRIYNWQDYIDEGLDDDGNVIGKSVMEEWQEWYYQTYNQKVEVVYDTFETNEVMMNTLKTGKTTYDLICPSEYTIQKMIRLNMLEEYDYELKDENGNLILENYQYVSPYLKNLFSDKGWDSYAVPYMWGTMGFIYNPDNVSEEKIKHWSILWDEEYKNMATAKDSVRDTYVVGVMYVYYDELMQIKEQYGKGEITSSEYNKQIETIMNRSDEVTIKKVEKALKDMKQNIYGMEVDSGKSDIVTGKVSINFAWSGDAVYSLDVAEEENDVYLHYAVPEEGSNVWFDGWVMPKGANKQLAQSFVNYLCKPEIAARNMNFIGYTSSIVGDDILDLIDDWYGSTMPEYSDELGSWIYNYDEVINLNKTDKELEVSVTDGDIYLGSEKLIDILTSINKEYKDKYACTSYDVDLSYLFNGAVSDEYLTDGKVIISVEERGRQFDTQYPDYETIERCGIMQDFGDQNDQVLAMWENVKIGDISPTITIIVIAGVVLCMGYLYGRRYIKHKQKMSRKKEFSEKTK